MKNEVINIKEKLNLFQDQWSPKIVAQMNDYHFKLVKIKGHFTWHDHKETDEVFLVINGSMRIDFREKSVELKAGEMFVVPKGIEHKPYSDNDCDILIIEPAETINTGDVGGEQTAPSNTWI
ncbi:MAG: cupin domain-containing protein [Spirochaetaceae bacterium]